MISAYASANSIPLFYIHSLGFYSSFSVQLPSHFPIVDTHPDPASTQDLRLLNPWPALLEFTKHKTNQVEKLSDHEHGHVPYLLLLLHYLSKWRASHDGNPPSNYDEKKDFKSLVSSGARTSNAEGGEENFDEATAAVLKSLNPPSISSGLREVFDSAECRSPNPASGNFWLIANALRNFHAEHAVLPLPGALPDMKAQSADYIQLQNIYKTKAREDVVEITTTVRNLEDSLDRKARIDDKEIEAFCKNAAFVKLIRGRPLHSAQLAHGKKPSNQLDWSDRASALSMEFHMPEESLLPIYLAFLAYDFSLLDPALPTAIPSSSFHSTVLSHATTFLENLATAAGLDGAVDLTVLQTKLENVLLEFERADGAELHNISALTGGMVAQEVIKVLTKQYVPMDNTCVFDGIASKSAVFNL